MFNIEKLEKPIEFKNEELFSDTLALSVYPEESLNTLVPNFKNFTDYAVIDKTLADHLYIAADNTLSIMYDQLYNFMEECDDEDKFEKLGITNQHLIESIKLSWEIEDKLRNMPVGIFNGIYGNMDMTIDEDGVPFVYEYNGNTPVMVHESVNIQHLAFGEIAQDTDQQYNSMYENMVEYWKSVKNECGILKIAGFSSIGDMFNADLNMFNADLKYWSKYTGQVTLTFN